MTEKLSFAIKEIEKSNVSSTNDFMEAAAVENHSGSDSDTNIDEEDAAEHYQPLSAFDSENEEQHLENMQRFSLAAAPKRRDCESGAEGNVIAPIK